MNILLWVVVYFLVGYIVAEFTFRLRKHVKQMAKDEVAAKGMGAGKSAGFITYAVYILLWPVVLAGGLYRALVRKQAK